MQSGVNSYESLSRWLAEDLGEITNETAIDDTRAFCATLDGLPEAPPWRDKLARALRQIGRQPDTEMRLEILNDALQEIFVREAMTPEGYRQRVQSLETGEELANRLKARNPLPTMDVLMLLDRDARSPSQCQRAAVMASAALRLHSDAEKDCEQPPLLGTTLAPGRACDRIVEAGQGRRLLVLARGVVYVVDLGHDPDASQAAALERTLEWIVADAAHETPSGVLPLLTAARRETCYEVRQALELHPGNQQAFASVENCLFAICLDDGASPEALEELCRRMFGNCANRWYGMTCLVVDESAQAGIIGSYGRGIDGVPALAFCAALLQKSLEIPLPETVSQPLKNSGVQLVKFTRSEPAALAAKAAAEVAAAFHHERCFLDVAIGTNFFLEHDLVPNAVFNYLIMLAANETFRLETLPAMSHAVSGRSSVDRKGGTDWVVVSTNEVEELAAAANEADWLSGLLRVSSRHASRATASRRGYSPSYFVRAPETDADRRLYEFFFEVGSRYAPGYRSYLFRPTRWKGTMDIMTSTLTLPDGVRYIGRAGAVSDVAGMFGMHMIFEPERTRLFLLPGALSQGRLENFQQALERLIVRFKAAVNLVLTEASTAAA
jgi:hypothetical protein